MNPLPDRTWERGILAILVSLVCTGTMIRVALLVPPARWRAAYFESDSTQTSPVVTRAVEDIGDDRTGFRAPSEPRARFVRWETILHLPRGKTVAFLLTSQTPSRLYVDGKLAIGIEEGPALRARGEWVGLAAGEHRLAVESVREEGKESAALIASLDGRAPKKIPAGFLRYPKEE